MREGGVEYEDEDKSILENIKLVTEKWRLVIRYPELAKLSSKLSGSLSMSCLIALLHLKTGNFANSKLWESCQVKLLTYINNVKATLLLFLEKIIIGRYVQSAIAPEVFLEALLVGFHIQNCVFTNNYTRASTLYCHFSLSLIPFDKPIESISE